MLVCLRVAARTGAPASNLKQALRRTDTKSPTAAGIYWLPVSSEVDACAVAKGVGCGGGPTISALALVNNKCATTKPLRASVKLLRDVGQIDKVIQRVREDGSIRVNNLNIDSGLLMTLGTSQCGQFFRKRWQARKFRCHPRSSKEGCTKTDTYKESLADSRPTVG